MSRPHPTLYQLNTRVALRELSATLGRPATLDDWPDAELDRLAERGFDWLWLLGVWQTGPAGRAIAPACCDLNAVRAVLPNLTDADIVSSPFAIVAYTCNTDFGGDAALARFRQRLQGRGVRLMLDFVPNHTALDHPWVWKHPSYYVHGSEVDLQIAPKNYCRCDTAAGSIILAYGRDPYFAGWPDTLQLDYRRPEVRQAMTAELLAAADRCDGLRCDMAMLLLPEVFARTWGGSPPAPFWPEAVAALKNRHPESRLLAEVYWDLEWTLQQQGFDYTYDKRLYDRLHEGRAGPVRGHLHADADFQTRSARFLENHDEPRSAAVFPPDMLRAAALVTCFVPGLRFFQDGQFEGRRFRVPMQIARRPVEPVDESLVEFYATLMSVLRREVVRSGSWQLLDCRPAWDGNSTSDQFIAFLWTAADRHLLVCVNYGPNTGQCYVTLPGNFKPVGDVALTDLFSPAVFQRAGDQLAGQGLYLDLPAWGFNCFELTPI